MVTGYGNSEVETQLVCDDKCLNITTMDGPCDYATATLSKLGVEMLIAELTELHSKMVDI